MSGDKKRVLTASMIAAARKAPEAPAAKEKIEVINFRVTRSFRYRMRRLALDGEMNLSQLLLACVDAYEKTLKS